MRVEKDMAMSREDLEREVYDAYDLSDNPMLRELGLDKASLPGETIQITLQELFDQGWLTGEERLKVTEKGRRNLQRRLQPRKNFFTH